MLGKFLEGLVFGTGFAIAALVIVPGTSRTDAGV
jgi:hypothetical protein